MKSLGIALGIVLAAVLILFGIFHAFGVTDKVAGPLASGFLGFITFIHDKVDKALSAGKSEISPGVVPVNEFTIHSSTMLVYATLISIGIFELFAFVASVPVMLLFDIIGGRTPSFQEFASISGLLSLPMILWAIFALGRWMGIRSARAGYWLLPSGIGIGRGLDLVCLVAFVHWARADVTSVFHASGVKVDILIYGSLVIAVGEIGVWRGNKERFGAYFNSLLRQVSEPTKGTLLSLAFEETRAAHQPSPAR